MPHFDSSLLDQDGHELARFAIEDILEGWHYAKLVWHAIPNEIYKTLKWYDEVVADQMLSYLDSALAAIDSYHLRIRIGDKVHPIYSLRITDDNDVSFRITPVTNYRTG